MERLTDDLRERMARQATENVQREYPNAPGHVLTSADDLRAPRDLHPAFFGSFDWHSSVHQHWLLARLLRLGLTGTAADVAERALATNLTAPNLDVEASYLRERPGFERTYGWAWLLKLAGELAASDGDAARARREALGPTVDAVRENWLTYLPKATYPIRAGTHANSAFGLVLALDHARAAADAPFVTALEERADAWFATDREYPGHLEPGGDDFLSPALVEAALMSRALPDAAFGEWFAAFLPMPPASLVEPAVVSDRSDGKTVHLDGLNLSRAWCWRLIAAVTQDADAERAAERHLAAAMPHLFSGEYAGEHWVSSFALLALTEPY